MNRIAIPLIAVTFITSSLFAQGKTELKTRKDSVSYLVGMNVARDMKRELIDADLNVLTRGIKDMLAGHAVINEEAAEHLRTSLQQEITAKQSDKNKKEGAEFLAENKKKVGVQTTSSGLQYKVLTEGSGPKPTADQTITVNYRGTLVDGTEFDSSFKRGKPVTYPLNRMIKGWIEGIQLMSVGSKYEFYVPSDLAYGQGGMSTVIPPNATLIFEVELLGVK